MASSCNSLALSTLFAHDELMDSRQPARQPSESEGDTAEAATESQRSGNMHVRSWLAQKGHRACLECRRKKTKCDMRQPVCGLCQRTGGSCTFPTKRKTPVFRRPPGRDNKRQAIDPDRLERLVHLLEAKLQDDPGPDQTPPQIQIPQGVPCGDAHPDAPVSLDSSANTAHTHLTDSRSASHATPLSTMDDPPSSAPEPSSKMRLDEVLDEFDWLDIPNGVATDLVHLYFDKIQSWLPLLHQPRFFARYMTGHGASLRKPTDCSDEDDLLLNGIFTLAARHSPDPYFGSTPASDRGAKFSDQATECYLKLRTADKEPTLLYLQGCILLSFHLNTINPCHHAWVLVGVCVRLAYDLDLCDVDDSQEHCMNPGEWTRLEERRRAFWVVWVLDTFVSVLSKRPCAINRHRMLVRLPVADEAWMAERPIESPIMSPSPAEGWKVLLASPNQDEWAWFLVANCLMSVCYDTCFQRHASLREQEELADATTCLSLAISQRFGLEAQPILFDSHHFSKANWTIGMHMMIILARSFLSMGEGSGRPGAAASVREVGRVISHWHPEYIALSHPFLACTILPTWKHSSQKPCEDAEAPRLHLDMLALVLERHASLWRLGSLLLDVLAILDRDSEPSDAEARLAKYFAIYFPCRSAAARTSSIKARGQAVSPRNIEDILPGDNQVVDQSSMPLFEMLDLPMEFPEMMHAPTNVDVGGMTGEISLGSTSDGRDDWSSRLRIDYLCDEDQYFKYVQL